MGCGVRHARCGLCAPAARGRGRERRAAEQRGARAQGRETASPMVLHCVVGEEVAATLRESGTLFFL